MRFKFYKLDEKKIVYMCALKHEVEWFFRSCFHACQVGL